MIVRLRISSWQTQLKLRTAALQGDYDDLGKESAAWQATADSTKELELPPSILDEISMLRASIDETRSTVTKRRNTLLQLQTEISNLGSELDRLDEEIKVAADAQRGELFRFDGTPVWRPDDQSHTKPPVAASSIPANGAAQEVVKSCLSLVIGILAGLLLFLFVLSVHLLLRARARSWAVDENLSIRMLGQVVLRPVSSSLMVTVAISLIVGWEVPGFLQTLTWYLLLIPLLRIVPRLISADLKPGIWTLAGLFAADGFLAFLLP